MNYNSENDIDLMAEDESYQGGAGKEDVMESNEVDIDVSEETSKKISLIYAWGRNTDGELGTGNADTSLLPCSPRGMKGYARHISTARTHSAIINNEGHIFMTGSTLFGKIGITTNVSNFRNLRRMEEMNKHFIIKVACGDYHTLALTDKGMLYSWGGRLWDKTGHKAEGIHLIEHLKKQKVIDIACGDFHSLAVDTEGLVYSWGGGKEDKNKGQLGHCNKKDVPQPVQLQFFKDKFVTKVACGDYHTMVMTNDNEIYAFGEGIYGQLGTGGKDDTGTPRKVILNFSLALEDYFRTD